jgi:hypothetical protein
VIGLERIERLLQRARSADEAVPSREAQDDAAARRLWQESLRLAGL